MGLRIQSPVWCLNLNEQIAQKSQRLHWALLGRSCPRRTRYFVDRLARRIGFEGSSSGAELVFAERATHAFPPTLQEWQTELEALAEDLCYPATSASEIETRFRAFIDLLAEA
jgi:hypothetical protein